MRNVILVIFLRVPVGVFLQDLDDSTAAGATNDQTGGEQARQDSRGASPVMTNGFLGSIVFAPSGALGLFLREPAFKLFCGHVDQFIEFPTESSDQMRSQIVGDGKGQLTGSRSLYPLP